MRKAGLKWSHAQEKGMLNKSDLNLRLKLAQKVRSKLPNDIWIGCIGFYLDGGTFTCKINPFYEARAPRAMVWRKPGQGLDFGFTRRGSQEETGWRGEQFSAAISF